MSKVKLVLQVCSLLALIPVVALATLRIENSNNDGASVLFPGGKLVSGELYSGPEHDWSFTSQIPTIDLELEASGTSRRMFILDADGKAYVLSGYMNSVLGRLWKQWAINADAGDDLAVIRVNGIRYERRLERITSGDDLDGAMTSFIRKYGGGEITPEQLERMRAIVADGESWIFRLAPRRS